MPNNLIIPKYLDHCKNEKRLSSHSIRAYQNDLNDLTNFKTDHYPKLKIEAFQKPDLLHFLRFLSEEKKLKSTSIKRKMASLRVFFRWLEDQELISVSPFYRLNVKISTPKRLPKHIPNLQMKTLIQRAAISAGFGANSNYSKGVTGNQGFCNFTRLLALELLFMTGLRVSELVSVRLDSIDLEQGWIQIIGKGDRERRVFLSDPDVQNLLELYLSQRQKSASNHDFLLVNSRGNPASVQFIRSQFASLSSECENAPRLTPHQLRHTCATHLLEEGLDIRFVQRLLGHQSITTTQIYTFVTDSSLQNAISNIHQTSRGFLRD